MFQLPMEVDSDQEPWSEKWVDNSLFGYKMATTPMRKATWLHNSRFHPL